jgi:hypothetical protein
MLSRLNIQLVKILYAARVGSGIQARGEIRRQGQPRSFRNDVILVVNSDSISSANGEKEGYLGPITQLLCGIEYLIGRVSVTGLNPLCLGIRPTTSFRCLDSVCL